MNLHGNAKLTPKGRLSLVRSVRDGTLSLSEAAVAFHVSVVTARKWVRRFEADGLDGLADRSSRPVTLRAATTALVVGRIEQLHRQRLTGARIALLTGVSSTTVSRVLKRLGLSRAPVTVRTPTRVVTRHGRHDEAGSQGGFCATT